jgi:hypothetical protein
MEKKVAGHGDVEAWARDCFDINQRDITMASATGDRLSCTAKLATFFTSEAIQNQLDKKLEFSFMVAKTITIDTTATATTPPPPPQPPPS